MLRRLARLSLRPHKADGAASALRFSSDGGAEEADPRRPPMPPAAAAAAAAAASRPPVSPEAAGFPFVLDLADRASPDPQYFRNAHLSGAAARGVGAHAP